MDQLASESEFQCLEVIKRYDFSKEMENVMMLMVMVRKGHKVQIHQKPLNFNFISVTFATFKWFLQLPLITTKITTINQKTSIIFFFISFSAAKTTSINNSNFSLKFEHELWWSCRLSTIQWPIKKNVWVLQI